ncbi:MAG: RNA polymerase sigma-70 factor, ECF subfamily [Parcubacteria group bacterium Athens0714_26]|nr:MAG: RNA polymerase sigma-70 factor, ECF subfamily [Parcubacteria group bacterium Athens1014_26]TSD02937.1 MAG: RNA polymerase sigma-70 factor, ECF subfamily [Parcubacteria group bacterium Athens0714_26]
MLENENKYIKQAQGGHKEAFGIIYSHYLPKIYRFISLKVNGKTTAEDLTHEVFLNAWKRLSKYETREFPFSSWLYQIARNEVIDFYRTNKKNISLENIGEGTLKTIESEDFDAVLSLEKIKVLIKFLKPDQQDVLIMRFIEDLSHDEIAAAIKKSAGAVRLIQYRAINSLKELYEKNNNNVKEI